MTRENWVSYFENCWKLPKFACLFSSYFKKHKAEWFPQLNANITKSEEKKTPRMDLQRKQNNTDL